MNSDNLFVDEEGTILDSKFLKKHNNIFITDEQVGILKKYNIFIEKYNNLNELIYDIEVYLNDYPSKLDDLEWVCEVLSENNYYNNVNK